jgi:hypothetical protein
MGDDIVETNVLLVASARDPSSPFKDCDHVSSEQQQKVLDWLMEFGNDGQREMVLDRSFKIWEEYRHKMTDQDLGLQVVKEKLQFARFIDISYDKDGHGCLPAELEKVVHDRSDRKFVAVAWIDRSQGGESTIVNAVDSDWCDWEEELKRFGITVRHLVDDLYNGWQRKREGEKKKRKKRTRR